MVFGKYHLKLGDLCLWKEVEKPLLWRKPCVQLEEGEMDGNFIFVVNLEDVYFTVVIESED